MTEQLKNRIFFFLINYSSLVREVLVMILNLTVMMDRTEWRYIKKKKNIFSVVFICLSLGFLWVLFCRLFAFLVLFAFCFQFCVVYFFFFNWHLILFLLVSWCQQQSHNEPYEVNDTSHRFSLFRVKSLYLLARYILCQSREECWESRFILNCY